MNGSSILVTGAAGEIGHALIRELATNQGNHITALDLRDISREYSQRNVTTIRGDVCDSSLINSLIEKNYDIVFHLAALLSTSAENNPDRAHAVNVDASARLLSKLSINALERNRKVKFIFPSSIAVHGVDPSAADAPVKEDQYLNPITVYGINKLYVEQFGAYLARRTRNTALRLNRKGQLIFRAIRFPGILSPDTVPTGGTSDYGPEMLHAAAQGKAYECFVKPDSTLPFCTMSDAVRALLMLVDAPEENLTRSVYAITAFSVSAEQIREKVCQAFPEAQIGYNPDPARLAIVESWPRYIDDSAARNDWGWLPEYNFERAFTENLIPAVRNFYNKAESHHSSVSA
ncbi:MAG: NAD-dependent epimerase/dehydratase family protein [Candidatus Dadabacteria bacterium]|nr:MAG: NAD-dependent epimerase/dehydratase family protein [Candidatus Dadabacteria bacterium]